MTYELKITADVVAWYAAIVASLGFVLAIYNAWSDRARIKITYKKKMRIVNGEPRYQRGKDYFNITVTNIGRRTIAIGNVAIKLNTKGSYLLGDSFALHKNKILNEQNPRVEFVVDEMELDFSNLHYIQVFDETGREYRKYLHALPTFRKWAYVLRYGNSAKK